MTQPIAYTADADTFCPPCADARYGPDPTAIDQPHRRDHEGNLVHPLMDWDNWCEPTARGVQMLSCGECMVTLATCEHEPEDCDCANCKAADAYTEGSPS